MSLTRRILSVYDLVSLTNIHQLIEGDLRKPAHKRLQRTPVRAAVIER